MECKGRLDFIPIGSSKNNPLTVRFVKHILGRDNRYSFANKTNHFCQAYKPDKICVLDRLGYCESGFAGTTQSLLGSNCGSLFV